MKHCAVAFGIRSCLGIGGFCLGILSVSAQPVPKLNSIGIEWMQRGTSATLNFKGDHLALAREIVVSGEPGLSASIVPARSQNSQIESSAPGITVVSAADQNNIEVKLTLASDASLVDRELRVVTADGISNPAILKTGYLPEVSASESNRSLEKAPSIELPAALNGVIASADEIHYFRFKARQGEHVIFNVYAYRMGSGLDSSIAVLDKNGKELARAEDTVGLDSVLDFNAPETSTYIFELRDYRYQGGGNFKYRVIAGALPYVASAFPFGGQRGHNLEMELAGANLDHGSKLLLNLSADAPRGRQEIRASSSQGLSNPFPIDVSDLPQFMEKEPNSALDQADLVTLPVAINGRISMEHDYDAFRFHAEKDQQFTFEVEAQRFGSSLDALLTLTDAIGNVIERNDDSSGADARIEHRFGGSGDYFLIIEDLLGRGGENFGYRLTASMPRPDFSLLFLPDAVRIHQGGRVPIRCELNRVNGFNETVKVSFEDLPSGVYCEPIYLSPNSQAGNILLLAAGNEASLGTGPLKLVARSMQGGKEIVHYAKPFAGDKPAKAGFITVLGPAPFSVQSSTLMASIEQNQSGSIELTAERRNGFSGEIRIEPEGFSTGRDPISRSFDVQNLTLKSGDYNGVVSLKTRLDSEITTRPVLFKAEATVNGQTITDYSAAIPVATSPIPFVLSTTMKRLVITAIPAGSQSAAAEATFAVRAERRAGFGGEIHIALEGVPEGVAATIDKIPAGAGEVTIKVVASEKAPAGKEFQINVTGTGVFNDRTYRFQPGAITLSVTAPESADAPPKLAGSN